jgi:hypothetical protein
VWGIGELCGRGDVDRTCVLGSGGVGFVTEHGGRVLV